MIQIDLTAIPAITQFGLGFLTSTTWDAVQNIYGVLLYDTLVSAIIALLVAVLLGLGIAVFLSEDFLYVGDGGNDGRSHAGWER